MKKDRYFQKLVFLTYIATVAYLCLGHFSDTHDIPHTFFGLPADKLAHFILFFPFPLLFHQAFCRPAGKWWRSLLVTSGILAIGAAIAYGTELLQGLTEYRTKDILDFLADFIALCVSSAIVLVIEFIKNGKK